jgi:hypothetical protein
VPPFGCSLGTTLFGNFNVMAGPADTGNSPGPGDVFLNGQGVFPFQQIVFTTPGPGPSWVVGPGAGTLDTIISFSAQTDPTQFFSALVDPIFIGPTNQSGGSLTVTESYCLGQATLSSCPTGQSGSIQAFQNGVNIDSPFVNLPSGFSQIAIQLEVRVDNLTDGSFGPTRVPLFFEEGQSDLSPLTTDAVAPEPSVTMLIVPALALICLVRRQSAAQS